MKRQASFVSPADGELPRLHPLARLEPVQPVDIDAAGAFAKPGVHTHENRDPLTEAQGFLLKYAGLTLVLLILTVGVVMRLELRFDVGIIVFAGLATGAYWLLAWMENWFTGPGVERHRLTMGSRVLLAQIDADERVRLAQIRLQKRHLDAQREMNAFAMQQARQRAHAQLEATERAQSAETRQHTHTPTTFDIAELEPPTFAIQGPQTLRTDRARQALLDCIIELYERGDNGEWLRMDAHGYVANSVPVPWGKRGGYTQTERRAMLDTLHRSRLACFDDTKRAWRVSVGLYPDAESALLAVGGVGGP